MFVSGRETKLYERKYLSKIDGDTFSKFGIVGYKE
jgi:hypothetical protein